MLYLQHQLISNQNHGDSNNSRAYAHADCTRFTENRSGPMHAIEAVIKSRHGSQNACA